ncbi:hypothetical protein B0H13DRAFT_1849919 [Mycena leptocephala]|nr:hypothetical protein B0H13DRAFT_1849919 [Mycena leptocephala]
MSGESSAKPQETVGVDTSGMQRGYTMSEMASLQREYLEETENEKSIFSCVTMLAIYYSASGERLERLHPERSSYKAGREFEAPSEEEPPRPTVQFSRIGRAIHEEEKIGLTDEETDEAEATAQEHWSMADPPRATLGAQTPFKSSDEFFLPRSPTTWNKGLRIPGPDLPDPIKGMASATSYGMPTESISQAMKRHRDQIRSDPRYQNWASSGPASQVPPFSSIPEERSGFTYRQKGKARDFSEPRSSHVRDPLPPDETGGFHCARNDPPETSQGAENIATPGDNGGDDDPSGEDSPSRESPRRNPWDPRGPRHRDNHGERPPPEPPFRGSSGPGGQGGSGGKGGNSGNIGAGGPPRGNPGGNGGGGNGSGNQNYPYVAPGAPYGTIVPTIKPEMKVEQLPEWDGSHRTAIDYFWDVGQLAALEGWMPEALGYWLPSRLKKGSAVHSWFTTLSTQRQKEMRSHYLVYLRVIKEKFLGRRWQVVMNLEFEQQAFRQDGHEKESPQQFVGRRTRAVRMLANLDDGGPLEVFLVMRRAPIIWSTILVLENIQSSEDLYDKVNEHEAALVEAVKRDAGEVVTMHNLASTLRRMGVNPNQPSVVRWANLAAVNEESTEDLPAEEPSEPRVKERKTFQGGDVATALESDQVTNTANGIDAPDNQMTNCSPSIPTIVKPLQRSVHAVRIEEIKDEYWESQARMPKAMKFDVEDVSLDIDEDERKIGDEANIPQKATEEDSPKFPNLEPPLES